MGKVNQVGQDGSMSNLFAWIDSARKERIEEEIAAAKTPEEAENIRRRYRDIETSSAEPKPYELGGG